MASKPSGKSKVSSACVWCIYSQHNTFSSAQRSREDPPDVRLSKFLSYICRHGAEKEGLSLLPGIVATPTPAPTYTHPLCICVGGFVSVSAILVHRRGKQYTEVADPASYHAMPVLACRNTDYFMHACIRSLYPGIWNIKAILNVRTA